MLELKRKIRAKMGVSVSIIIYYLDLRAFMQFQNGILNMRDFSLGTEKFFLSLKKF